MSELEARFRISLEGKNELADFFKGAERDAKSFSQNVRSSLMDTGKEIAGFGLATAKSLAHMATGNIGIAQQAKNILEFRDSLSDLAVQAGISDGQLGGLRNQIHTVAKASNQMQGDITDALSAFVAKTGDIETARKNLELYAKTATATGASLKDVALIGVELSDKLGIKDQRSALGILSAQGRAGAVEIRDLATKAPKIFSAAASMFGVKGEEGLRGTGALAQVFAKGFGGTGAPASISTSIENTFTDIMKAQGKIEGAGIKVQGRDPYEVIKDLIRKTDGDPRQLLKAGGHGIFDVRAMRGINVMAREYKETGGFATFDRFKNIQGADLEGDVKRRMSTGQAQLQASQISIAASADKNLGDAFDRLAHHASAVSDTFEWATSHIKTSVALLIAGLATKNLIGAVLSGGGAGGGLARTLGLGGVQHVWVDNMGMGGMGGGPGDSPGTGKLKTLLKVTAVGIAAYEGASAVDDLSGGRLSGGVASGIAKANNLKSRLDAIEGPEVLANQYKLERLRRERNVRIRENEAGGMSHGQAIFQADQAVKNLTVNINGDQASAETDDGTRSPTVMVKRQAYGGR